MARARSGGFALRKIRAVRVSTDVESESYNEGEKLNRLTRAEPERCVDRGTETGDTEIEQFGLWTDWIRQSSMYRPHANTASGTHPYLPILHARRLRK